MDVADLRADGESADESDYATCQIGDNEKIRYVHIREHPDLDRCFSSVCSPDPSPVLPRLIRLAIHSSAHLGGYRR